jgi:hypothetical protein
MMYLKVMSYQNLPDDDPSKNFEIICVDGNKRVIFKTDRSYSFDYSHVIAVIGNGCSPDDLIIQLTGNAYLMNSQGKTIAYRCSYNPINHVPNGLTPKENEIILARLKEQNLEPIYSD